MVISIESDPTAEGEWFLNTTNRLDDLLVADLAIACAVKELQIDIVHIHVAGFSAGGKQAAQMAIRRSSYVASVVLYSGGLFTIQLDPYPTYEDTNIENQRVNSFRCPDFEPNECLSWDRLEKSYNGWQH